MKKRIAAIFSIGVMLVCGAIFAVGQGRQAARSPQQGIQPPPPPPPPIGIPPLDHLSRDLNLTDAQQAELKTFFDAERQTMETLAKRMDEERKQLDAATANGQFDEAQVRALATQQAQTMAEMIVEHKRVDAKIYSVLTPEQRSFFVQRRRRRGPEPPPPPPPPPGDRDSAPPAQ